MRKFIYLLAMILAVMLSTTNGWGQQQYCSPSISSVDGNGILEVKFGQSPNIVDNTSHPNSSPFYGNYYNMKGDIQAGEKNEIEITYETGYTYGTVIWIDFNNNFTFDPTEVVAYGTSNNGWPTTFKLDLDIPDEIPAGEYRMRIFGADVYLDYYINNSDFSYLNACQGTTYAICEDYTVNVIASASTCPKPKDLAVTPNSIIPNSATITWTAGGSETNWILSYSSDGGTIWNDVNVSTTPEYTFSNLTKETTYKVKVKADCGTTDGQSGETSPIEFTTPPTCPAVTNISSNNATATSADISWTQTGTETQWEVEYKKNSDENWTSIGSYATTNSCSLTDLTPNTSYLVRVRAYCNADDQSSWTEGCFKTLNNATAITYFYVNNMIGDAAIDGANHTVTATVRADVDLTSIWPDISASSGASIYYNDEKYYYGEIDFNQGAVEFTVKAEDETYTQDWTITIQHEACATPYNVSVNNVERVRATINWDIAGEDEKDYEFIVSKNQIYDFAGVEATHTLPNSTETSYVLEGLERSTTYYAYMRHTCGDEGNSDWVSAGSSFTTGSLVECEEYELSTATSYTLEVPIKASGSGYYTYYTYSQQIYTPTELGLTGSNANISKIALKFAGYGPYSSHTINGLQVFMANTTQETFSSSSLFIANNLTQVFSGDATFTNTSSYSGWDENSGSWSEITLNTPFQWNEGSNIVVAFYTPNGGNSLTDNYFIYDTKTNATCIKATTSTFTLNENNVPGNTQNTSLKDERACMKFIACEEGDACPEVTSVIGEGGKNTATVTWIQNEEDVDYLNRYELVISENSNLTDFTGIEPDYSGTDKSHTLDNYPSGTYYAYVRCVCDNGDGESGWVRSENSFNVLSDCNAVEDLTVNTVGGIEITWTAGDETNYNLQYRNENEEEWHTINNVTSPYSLTGLELQNYYQVRIQADCGSAQSVWSSPEEFYVPNNATAITGFNVDNMIGDAVIDGANHTVTATVRADVDLTSIWPEIYASSGASIYYNDEIYYYDEIDFSQGAVEFTVKAEDETYTQDWTITIQHEACATPYSVSVNNVERVRATINWGIAGEDAKDYEFIVSKNQIYDFTGKTATHTLSNSTETSFVLEDLERSTTYYAYMRHTCGDDGNSDWVSAGSSFTTGSLVDCDLDKVKEISEGTYNYKMPLSTYEYSSKSQQIYTKSELNAQGITSGTIKKIAFYFTRLGTEIHRYISVAIGTTNDDYFTSDSYYPTTEVKTYGSNEIYFSSTGWVEIALDEPYYWDGNSNIVLQIAGYCNNMNYDGNGDAFKGKNFGQDMSAYYYDDNSRYSVININSLTKSTKRANIKFTFCGEGDPCPQVKSITATGGKHSAEISWTPDVIDYLDHYELVISENGELDDEALEASEKTYSGTEKSVVTTEQPIGTYYAYVRCVCGNSDGTSDWVRSEAFEVLTDCDAVTDLYATENGLITWTAADETSYNLQYRMKGAEAWTAVTEGIGDGECQLTGLAMHTTYEVRIQADCGGEDQSNWSEPVEFTTPCGEITITKAEPYVYGFEDTEFYTQDIPCWGVELETESEYISYIPYTWNNDARSGNMCVVFTTYSDWAFAKQLISTPAISNDINTLEMSLWAKEKTDYYGPIQFEIGVLDNSDSYTALQQITISSTDYQEFTIPLENAPTGSRKIAINCLTNNSVTISEGLKIYLDDITVRLAPTCKKPTAISVDNITYNGAKVNVTAEATDFEYVVSTSAIDVENIQDGDIKQSSTNPIVLTGLSEETDYYVAVRCSCGTDDKSDWMVYNTTFTTAAQCYPIASDIQVDGDNSQVILSWTAPTGATGYKYILSESESETPDFTSAETTTTASKRFEVGGKGQGNLKSETKYWFYVKNDCNEGAHANDYKSVSFTTPETCPSPKNVTVTDVEKYQFTINWDNSPYAPYDQEYELIVNTTGNQPDIDDEAQVDVLTDGEYTIQKLDRNTRYYVYMRGTCNDVTEWKLVADATTLGLGMDCDYEIVANGTATNQYAPICGEGISNAQKAQMLYPASKLQTLQGNNISQMKFFLNYGSSRYWGEKQFNIKMAMTTATDLSSDFINETMTTVYSGPLTIDGSTMTIEFDNVFEYTANNLLIEFEAPENLLISSGLTKFYSETNDFVCTRFNYIDYNYPSTSQNLPKVEFKVCEEVKACPEVTNLAAEKSHKSATITWDASDGDFLTGYEFAWDDKEITDFRLVQTQTIGENEDREVTLNHLTPSTPYYVYVRALCPAEKNPGDKQSNWVSLEFTTNEFNCDVPNVINVTLNDMFPESSINIRWTPNGKQIELYYTTDDNFVPTSETDANENVTSQSDIELGYHSLTGLTVNTTYYVWARTVCDLDMGNEGKSEWTFMGSATTEADYKDITYENVTYTISGIHQGEVSIMSTSYNESDLVESDYDITYSTDENGTPDVNSYFNYKHVINVPDKFTDGDKQYNVFGIYASAFDNSNLTQKVRVNIPLNKVEYQSNNDKVIISFPTGDSIRYKGTKYYASKAYKVNLCEGAEIVQRPFGYQTLKISCPDGDEIGEFGVFTTPTGARLDFEEGWAETWASTSNLLEASLYEEESAITATRLNKVRIAATAENVNIPKLGNCEELTFQTDVTGGENFRKYPECVINSNITLNDTKVKMEMTLNNKEYYYFALPFGCDIDDIEVVADGVELERSYSVEDAAEDAYEEHRYVLLTWDESEYDGVTSGYVALDGSATELEANKGYAILIMESYSSWLDDHNVTVDATATFTANSDYYEMVSTSESVDIATTRYDYTSENAYSGWNLVGNPYYSTIKGSWYSYNQYARKIAYDRGGDDASVIDYKPEVPVFNVDIKPFEVLFVQQDDGADDGTLTVGDPALQNTQQAPAMLPEYITITLNDNDRMMDRTTIINNDMASDGYMQKEDLIKSHLSGNEIYTTYYDIDFSFNEMNIEEGKKVIPVGVKVMNEGDYTIALSEELTNYGIGNVVLHDKTLNKFTTLSDGEEETLHLGKGRTDGRLELIITVNETITGGEDIDGNSKVEVFVNNGIATINGAETGATVMITDATGKTIYMTEATGDRIDYQFAVRGVYMITVRGEKVSTVKVVY